MAALLVQHTVKDYVAWRKVFDAFEAQRKSGGALSSQVYRDASDPNKITVIDKWESLASAQKFASSPELKAAMEQAGVVSVPSITFLDEA